MNGHVSHAIYWSVGIAVGIPLLIIADRIRRRTRGRVRHLELHLLAWLPGAILEVAMYIQDPSAFQQLPFTLRALLVIGCAAIVYPLYFILVGWFGLFGNDWERSEEKLDRKDAAIREEEQRRERIESYKYKKGQQ